MKNIIKKAYLVLSFGLLSFTVNADVELSSNLSQIIAKASGTFAQKLISNESKSLSNISLHRSRLDSFAEYDLGSYNRDLLYIRFEVKNAEGDIEERTLGMTYSDYERDVTINKKRNAEVFTNPDTDREFVLIYNLELSE